MRRYIIGGVAAMGLVAAAPVVAPAAPSRASVGRSWRQPAAADRAAVVPAGQRGLEVALGLVEADQAAAG